LPVEDRFGGRSGHGLAEGEERGREPSRIFLAGENDGGIFEGKLTLFFKNGGFIQGFLINRFQRDFFLLSNFFAGFEFGGGV